MRDLTDRQESIWRKKMLKLELRLLNYYATRGTNPTTVEPDGSFCMSAFKTGWYLRAAMNRKRMKRVG